MGKLRLIFERLRALQDPAVELAMAAALPTADAEAAGLIAQRLADTRHPEARLALFLHFHRLPPDAQAALIGRATDFRTAMQDAACRRQTQGPANILRIVREARDPSLADLVVRQLRQGAPETWPDAAACLLELAASTMAAEEDTAVPAAGPAEDPGTVEASGGAGAAAAATLEAAVEEALALFGHHQQIDVLHAVIALASRPMNGAMRQLGQRSHAALLPLRKILEIGETRAARRALLIFLRCPALAKASLAGIRRCVEAGWLGEVLASSHLLDVGEVAAALRDCADAEPLCPLPGQVAAMSVEQSRCLPRWLAALALSPQRKAQALARLARSADAPTRLAALRQLLALAPVADVAADVASFCCDADPLIARIALRHLFRTQWHGLPKLLLSLINSPHEGVRKLAASHLAPLGFQRFWESWPRLKFAQRLAAGRALLKLDLGFDRLLGEKLTGADRAARLRAISIVDTLGLGATYESPLIALAGDADEVLAASAVRALGSAGSPAAVETLERALTHRDSRVRANAVESLQQLQSKRHVQRLIEMARGDDNRPRANAIRALMEMRAGDALGALVEMLGDARPEQRTSALWLVDHLGVVEMAREVAEISITDPDNNVRGRAGNVIQHLIAVLRNGGDHEAAATAAQARPEEAAAR